MGYPYLFVNYSENYEERKHYIQGSAPDILQNLISYFDALAEDISEIYCCMYLYNNPILHKKMKQLSEKGIRINIISIPLEGYDNDMVAKSIGDDTNYKQLLILPFDN